MNDIAKAILQKNEHAVLTTVTPEGAPWAVPVHVAFDDKYIYWVSNDETIHSANIALDGRVSIVIFDSRQTNTEPGTKGAVYISSTAQELSGDEEKNARKVYFDLYPHRNIDKFREWSIYGAPIGELNTEKSKDAMLYYCAKETL